MPITSPRSSSSLRGTAVPLYMSEPMEWLRLIAVALRNLFDGKINTVGEITLTASQATTTLTDPRIGPGSVITLVPNTQNAGGELGIWITLGDGSATINHATNADTDRTFKYVIHG